MTQLALIFATPTLSASCITKVELQVKIARVGGTGSRSLGVYASDAANYLASAHTANAQLDLGGLISTRPRGFVPDAKAGRLVIDVTELYRLWAAQGPFPGGATLDNGTPVGLIIRPPTMAAGTYSLGVAVDAASPTLVVTESGC